MHARAVVSGPIAYARYADFLDADTRRRGDALEFGHDWHDGPYRCRACWYEATGELTIERLTDGGVHLDLEDFHQGVCGPVEILALIPTRAALETLLGRWPNVAPNRPRTVAWLRSITRPLRDQATAP